MREISRRINALPADFHMTNSGSNITFTTSLAHADIDIIVHAHSFKVYHSIHTGIGAEAMITTAGGFQ
jgi:hypothetical protein